MFDRIIRIVTKNKYFFLLLVIAAILRLYQLEGFVTFLGDQGRDALIVKKIVTFEHFPAVGAPSSVGQVYLGPFYYYLIAPFLLLSFFNPIGLALGVALMWLAGIICSYFIVKKHFGFIYALLFSIFLIFSSTLVDLARFSWNPNLLPLFSFLTLYFLHRLLKQKELIIAVLFGSFLAFSIQLHYLALLLFIPTVVWAAFFIYKNKNFDTYLKQGTVALGSFVFFSIPLIVFDIRHNFLNTKNFIALFMEGKISAENSYIARLLETIDSFFTFALQIEIPTAGNLIIFLIFILSSIVIIRKKKSSFLLLHFVAFLVFILGFSYLGSRRIPHYFAPAYLSFYVLLAGFPFLFIQKKLQLIIGALVAVLFITIQAPHYSFFWNSPNNQITYAKEVAESFEEYVHEEPIQIVALPHTETDGHFRYFLDLQGYDVLPHDSPKQPGALYVICREECEPTGDPHWQIAAFENKQLADSWEVEDVTIYKVTHGKTEE